jgi:hypothetical protein
MRRMLLFGFLAAAMGCARNHASEAAGARIHEDTTLTARDTTNPNDTMPRIRDTVPDSAQH